MRMWIPPAFDSEPLERILFSSFRPHILHEWKELRKLVSERVLVRHDIRLLERCKCDPTVVARVVLTDRYHELVLEIGQSKQRLSDLACGVLRRVGNHMVSIDPWDLGTTSEWRHQRYKELKKCSKTVREQLEFDLLIIVYEWEV